MIPITPHPIRGNWQHGVALDVHTRSSTHVGVDEYGHAKFENVRSEAGELLYQLKYRWNPNAAKELVDVAVAYLNSRKSNFFDTIVPVPPSTPRTVQPVILLANAIGSAINIPVAQCVTRSRATPQLKNVSDPEERKTLLQGLFAVDERQTAGKKVLLFDDLFRSGATMNAVTDALLKQGRASAVFALTITSTRINR